MKMTGALNKLFYKRFIIGISRCDIKEVIRAKSFDPDIKWLPQKSLNKFQADPFLLDLKEDKICILLEEFDSTEKYAKIALWSLNDLFELEYSKVILDTKSHISYPFVFNEGDKIYVFPESRRSGYLSCYEFNPDQKSLTFVKHLLDIPVEDATIIRADGKYWIFSTIFREDRIYELHIFHSPSLLGPYESHVANPIKRGLDGIRSAGAFITIDNCLYRPTQNCKNDYGESITLNKVTELNELSFNEIPFMKISINNKNKFNRNIHTIHTINVMKDLIVVDGKYWTFAPFHKLFGFIRKHFKTIVK